MKLKKTNPPAPCLQGATGCGERLQAVLTCKAKWLKAKWLKAKWLKAKGHDPPPTSPLHPKNQPKTRKGGQYLPSWGGQKP